MADQKTTDAKKRKLVKGRHRSAIKRQRQNQKRATRNQAVLSRVKTAMKKVRQAVNQKDRNLAQASLRQANSLLGKAAAAGLLHPRNASRHVSRLASLVQAL